MRDVALAILAIGMGYISCRFKGDQVAAVIAVAASIMVLIP